MRLIASWLRRLADYLDPPLIPAAPDLGPLLARAVALAAEQDARWPDRDGEAKRHQVYAALIKAFPGESKRVIARAIEDAL